MEVKSEDDDTHMCAIELKVCKGEEPQNPFAKEEFVTWEEYAKIYIRAK